MNTLRALNVRTRFEEVPGHLPNPEPDTGASSSCLAPYLPAGTAPEEPSATGKTPETSRP